MKYKTEIKPCPNCGTNEHAKPVMVEGSQYLRVRCSSCGREGTPAWFFKDCGIEDMDEDEIAIENWNESVSK